MITGHGMKKIKNITRGRYVFFKNIDSCAKPKVHR